MMSNKKMTLFSTLKQENILLKELKELFIVEFPYILSFDVEKLNEINKKKRVLYIELQNIINTKNTIFKESGTVSFEALCHSYSDDEKSLSDLWNRSIVYAKEIQNLANKNRSIVSHGLKSINAAIKSITSVATKKKGYTKSGKNSYTTNTGALIKGSF